MAYSALSPSIFDTLAGIMRPADHGTDQWAHRVNTTVGFRFDAFAKTLVVTPGQRAEAMKKVAGIVQRLNREYWGSESETDHAIIEGSWGKGTETCPPRDVDLIFVVPYADYLRFQEREGNKQSQLLQEIKDTIAVSYPTSHMRGDGQVVLIDFTNGHGVEVVPAIELTNGKYWICNTHDNGSYKTVDPKAEISAIQISDTATSGATRDLIRMIKRWQQFCGVPLKSFQIDLLVTDFLLTVSYGVNPRGLYDWLVRDFFRYLLQRQNTYVTVPGTGNQVWLGSSWASRAQSAYDRAAKASKFEEDEFRALAVAEWQKLFGTGLA